MGQCFLQFSDLCFREIRIVSEINPYQLLELLQVFYISQLIVREKQNL